jgi:hypothetical protein
VLELADHLPAEAAEALLELATGGRPVVSAAAVAAKDAFEHPDAQRRFRVVSNVEELERALDYPWEKWTVFLHPAQRSAAQAGRRAVEIAKMKTPTSLQPPADHVKFQARR